MRNLEDSHPEFLIITKKKSEEKEGQEHLRRIVTWPGEVEECRRSKAVFSHGRVTKK